MLHRAPRVAETLAALGRGDGRRLARPRIARLPRAGRASPGWRRTSCLDAGRRCSAELNIGSRPGPAARRRRRASTTCARSRGCSAGPSPARSSPAGSAWAPAWPRARAPARRRAARDARAVAVLPHLPVQRRDDAGQDRPRRSPRGTSTASSTRALRPRPRRDPGGARPHRAPRCWRSRRRRGCSSATRAGPHARASATHYLDPLSHLQVDLLARWRAAATTRPGAAPGAAAHRQRHRRGPAQHRLSATAPTPRGGGRAGRRLGRARWTAGGARPRHRRRRRPRAAVDLRGRHRGGGRRRRDDVGRCRAAARPGRTAARGGRHRRRRRDGLVQRGPAADRRRARRRPVGRALGRLPHGRRLGAPPRQLPAPRGRDHGRAGLATGADADAVRAVVADRGAVAVEEAVLAAGGAAAAMRDRATWRTGAAGGPWPRSRSSSSRPSTRPPTPRPTPAPAPTPTPAPRPLVRSPPPTGPSRACACAEAHPRARRTGVRAGPRRGRRRRAARARRPPAHPAHALARHRRGQAHVPRGPAHRRRAATFATLVADADVLVQSYRPGALAARGFGPADLARLRPGLVVASISAYGRQGPWAERRAASTAWCRWPAASPTSRWSWHATSGRRRSPARPSTTPPGGWPPRARVTALRRRQESGGAWLVQASLARTARWLDDLGRVERRARPRPPTPARRRRAARRRAVGPGHDHAGPARGRGAGRPAPLGSRRRGPGLRPAHLVVSGGSATWW